MTRWILLAALAVGATAGATLLVNSGSGDSDALPGLKVAKPRPEGAGPPGKIVLDAEPVHDFGTMAQQAEDERTWVVKNTGAGPIQLRKGTSTCSCTIANLADGETATIPPGGQTEIRLGWETRMNNGRFEKSATILVYNDPDREEITFVVSGIVRPAIITYPPDGRLDLGSLANDGPRKVTIALASPDRPDLKIESIKVARPELFQVETFPLNEAERMETKLGPGFKLEITVTPGKALAHFAEEILVKTDHPKQAEVMVVVQGRIVGPIAATPESLSLKNIRARQGGEGLVTLWVRNRKEPTTFTVAKAPPGLSVTVKPVESVSSDADGRPYRMTVTIPPGHPTGPIKGSIILKTDHPKAETVTIPVDMLVWDPS